MSHTPGLWPVKDIHDFNGVHGNWLKHGAVTLVVHHHHEEITAGDLLDHKGPVNHSTERKQRRGRKMGEEAEEEHELDWQEDMVHGIM